MDDTETEDLLLQFIKRIFAPWGDGFTFDVEFEHEYQDWHYFDVLVTLDHCGLNREYYFRARVNSAGDQFEMDYADDCWSVLEREYFFEWLWWQEVASAERNAARPTTSEQVTNENQ